MKRRFEKGGIEDPMAHLMDAFGRHDFGLSTTVAIVLVYGSKFFYIRIIHVFPKL